MEEKSPEEREFQNLLAKRGHLVTLLIATVTGTVGLLYVPFSAKTCVIIAVGFFFIVNIIKNLVNADLRISEIIKREK